MPGLIDKLFKRKKEPDAVALGTVGSRPYTTGWSGSMYQQVLVRSVIERFAVACSKLKPELQGTSRPLIKRAIEASPNQFQTWPQFLYRCATLYMNNTTVCVVPTYKAGTDVQSGFYPLPLIHADVIDYGGEYWMRYTMPDGERGVEELSRIAIVNRFQYRSDWFGDGNILANTLSMLKAQEMAQRQSLEDSSQLRFVAQLNGQVREDDMDAKRDRFYKQNLSSSNKTNIMMYDATFASLEQLKAQNWTIPAEEMTRIENNVFDYFGINRRILQNNYDENAWDAFYEGCVEPFAIALSESMTKATYAMQERPDNRILFTTNRLEYASASSKRNMNKDMLDRGAITINEAREILQMPPVDSGDVLILRGEYKVGRTIQEILDMQKATVEAASGGSVSSSETDVDSEEGDNTRPDSDGYSGAGDTDNGDVTSTNQDRFSENSN